MILLWVINHSNASIDVKTEEFNLREWVRSDLDSIITGSAQVNKPFIVPDNININHQC